jgi:biopolymer transport protein ExbD
MWAFLSVQLVLLIVFMLNPTILSPHFTRSVDLAQVNHATPMRWALREDAMIVTVNRDGNVFLGALQVRVFNLPGDLQERLHRGAESKVYIKADARVKYGDVVAVVSAVRTAGIEQIAYMTELRTP